MMGNSQDVTVAIVLPGKDVASGAGWLLPDGDVLTCDHVVEGVDHATVELRGSEQPRAKYEVVRRWPGDRDPATELYIGDLALLRSAEGGARLTPSATYRAARPDLGDDVIGYGFPEPNSAGQGGKGRLGQRSAVSRVEVLDPDNAQFRMWQGFSGCPVMSRRENKIVGLFAVTISTVDRGYLIPIRAIHDWLVQIDETKVMLDIDHDLGIPIAKIHSVVFSGGQPQQPFPLHARKDDEPDAGGGKIKASDLIDHLDGRHALLRGDGGSGKSTYFVEVAEGLHAAAVSFAWLNAKALALPLAADHESVRGVDALGNDNEEIFESAFETACLTAGWKPMLQDTNNEIYILVDGLNEVGEHAARLLEELVKYANARGKMVLLINARTTTRLDKLTGFISFSMLPLEDHVIAAAMDDELENIDKKLLQLLSKPQMLSIALRIGGFDIGKRSEMFERYLAHALKRALPAENDNAVVLDALAEATYQSLAENHSLTWPHTKFRERFENALPEGGHQKRADEVIKNLIEQGTLVKFDSNGEAGQHEADEKIEFEHPLITEWLTAKHFVNLPSSDWSNTGFATISIGDSSDDGLKLAFEIVDPDRRDEFLTLMYDWRWQRVMEFVVIGIQDLSDQLRKALIGLNALRLADRFAHTRNAAHPFFERLAESGDEFVSELMAVAVQGDEAILEVVRNSFADEDIAESLSFWPPLLSGDSGHLVSAVLSNNPFQGWAASNLIRIGGLDAERSEQLRLAYRASHTTALAVPNREPGELLTTGVGLRWRIVHTLGRTHDKAELDKVVPLLKEVWRDTTEPEDVRFGACRALIKISLDHPELRGDIHQDFCNYLEEIRDNPEDELASVKVVGGLWWATQLSDGVFESTDVAKWDKEIRKVLASARDAAVAKGWDVGPIEAAIAK